MKTYSIGKSVLVVCRNEFSFREEVRQGLIFLLVALCVPATELARAQADEKFAGNAVVAVPAPKKPVAQEISVTGMVPYGDYRMFSATVRCNAWTIAAVEYDRNSWGHILHSQFDYVAEVIPVMILSQPAVSDFWGNARSPNQEYVPGISISPFGLRFLWLEHRAIRPYILGKIGAAVFTKKAFSQNASYANFNVQADFGVLFKMTEQVDLRVDPFAFFHVSNGYLAASNPGMDELAMKFGITYHLKGRSEAK